jgi:hypothetical protein
VFVNRLTPTVERIATSWNIPSSAVVDLKNYLTEKSVAALFYIDDEMEQQVMPLLPTFIYHPLAIPYLLM